ncbi:ArsR/SmtB family transcription factor [Sphingomonas montanisoli]|uniref:Metalloregulator ArsR/SmtB family transcription factor n=1 Tax=Sphingomonas montanisoli TaxID=2606412 RepID=A0A5D9C8B9_9SPHN|nr:metalloregulator ArsR/SmtB family transcription factor [Sphingomonas montanisoli]TZG27969.1 metalloregulator ArsR/SmtB family transcription factor [Sphingomonas montanisoli]
MSAYMASDASAIFRALADPTRLRIFQLLRAMELSIGELAQVLGQSQPRVSRHVKILADAGLTDRRKEGSWVFLGLGDGDRVAPLVAALDAWTGEGEDAWVVADRARLAAVRADRASAAARYFADHAEEWDAIRSLHVPESKVEARIVKLLDGSPIGRLVDIGTGTGRMIELLGPNAQSALGIDRSPEMLRLARAKFAEEGLSQAELRQGDMYALPLGDGAADVVILHQVLHFAQQPAAAIAEAARLLDAGGRLLIVDFASHDREELRTRDAHARLGFDDDQLRGWFEAAGLSLVDVDALVGDALTVKLWLGARGTRAALKAVR